MGSPFACMLFFARYGAAPLALEEYASLPEYLKSNSGIGPREGEPGLEVPLGADGKGRLFALGPAGVLTPWGTPYGYENRIGAGPWWARWP